MISINKIKEQAPNSYYHVYNRGNNKQIIFVDDADYDYFLYLLERYLSKNDIPAKSGVLYPKFINRVEIIAYCLMPNHFHLLLYQFEITDMEMFMRSLTTSYSKYFNLKYRRTGSVFEGRYMAVKINSDEYLQHISRYIHQNPDNWDTYKYSSLEYYKNNTEPYWLNSKSILDLFDSRESYIKFVAEYKEVRDGLKRIKREIRD